MPVTRSSDGGEAVVDAVGAKSRRIEVVPFNGKREEYPAWSKRMRARLLMDEESKAAFEVVDGKRVLRQRADDAAQRAASEKVYYMLLLCLEEIPGEVIERATEGNGLQLWKEVRGFFAPADAVSIELLNAQIREVKGINFSKMSDMILKVSSLRAQLMATGSDRAISDEQLVAHVCMQLPSEYGTIRSAYTINEDKRRDWLGLCDSVRAMERLVLQSEQNELERHGVVEPSVALYSMRARGSRFVRGDESEARGGGRGRSEYRDMSKVRCYFCDELGHMQRDCREARMILEEHKRKREGERKEARAHFAF